MFFGGACRAVDVEEGLEGALCCEGGVPAGGGVGSEGVGFRCAIFFTTALPATAKAGTVKGRDAKLAVRRQLFKSLVNLESNRKRSANIICRFAGFLLQLIHIVIAVIDGFADIGS